MRISDFDYDLPEQLIAQAPIEPRDAARLLVVPSAGPLGHRMIAELPELLADGDLLVLNDTRVIPARLLGKKESGGKAELLLCEPLAGGLGRRWRAMGQASKRLRAGARILFDGLTATIEASEGEGFYTVLLDREGAELEVALARAGRLPLPPYIRRPPDAHDLERYQTVLARAPGSAAAPTAGLHFTAALLERLAARGIERTTVTLHVGPGTFLPVRAERLDDHRMHGERYSVPEEAVAAVARARSRGGRVLAVGTTSARTLESAWRGDGLVAGEGRTELFIRPGHSFGAVDALLTNFHLPRSTLLVLACALGGRERILDAYREAVARRYRFFSYGDAMLIERVERPGVAG
ncbi:MAG TPA: tRNA preQ1(34) S-adenosylmethionine ribosyltransferase-isomerase QueA [Anaeromyxobacteraceae bacterium]|nr:tRNA preQ1(34) S-adenosylmethionine ribosyltransferase-isomerase QueA [Anaeromyxobacteraceae bacterium]